jgi:cell cycle sensor histidine kinase DivJ
MPPASHSVESLARTSFWLLYAEEDRYRLLARNMTDVITRHRRSGRCSSSAGGRAAVSPRRGALGHGLFDRVHVADGLPPALAIGALDCNRSVEFRVRDPPEPTAHSWPIRLDRDALPGA